MKGHFFGELIVPFHKRKEWHKKSKKKVMQKQEHVTDNYTIAFKQNTLICLSSPLQISRAT
jgi:hypothetical protein